MTTEQIKEFMSRYLNAAVGQDANAFMELLAPGFVAHVGNSPKNRAEFVQHMSVFNSAFSDMQVIVLDLITDGEKVVARTTWRGTQTGAFMGLPGTGKQIEIEAYIVERIKDGKSVEHWSLFDQLTMLQQLGLVPQPQASQ